MHSLRRHSQSSGSVLITAAIAAGILAIVVGTILTYMGNEYFLNLRSHRWTQALHLSEAGIEIGFAEFNNYYTKGIGFQSARGWSNPSAGVYTMTVTNYTDSLSRVVGNIQVTVLGVGTSSPWIQAVGTCPTLPRGPTVSRGVKVILAGSSKTPVALAAKSTITLSGGAAIDSFDSSDPTKSTLGLYDTAKRQANGNVGTNAGIQKSEKFSGGISIYGTTATGPGGTVDMSGNASVGPTLVPGDRAYTVAAGESLGYIRHDFAVDIPDVTLPAGLSSASSLGNVGNNTTISSGDWQANKIQLSGSGTVTVQGTVRLYVTQTVNLSGGSAFIIAPNSSLEIYVAGSVSVSGGGVVNNTGLSANNSWYGLPSSTSWSLSGGSGWIGTVYAPSASVTMSGNSDASGAMIGNTLTYSGTAGFHYDEALAHGSGGTGGYLVNSWSEMKMVGGVWQ